MANSNPKLTRSRSRYQPAMTRSLTCIHLTEEGDEVKQVRINDGGITVHDMLMWESKESLRLGWFRHRGDLFKTVAAMAKLTFKPADKIPCTYDGKPFKVDGTMELDLTFSEKGLSTTMFIWRTAAACRGCLPPCSLESSIMVYPEVHTKSESSKKTQEGEAKVPLVRIFAICNG